MAVKDAHGHLDYGGKGRPCSLTIPHLRGGGG